MKEREIVLLLAELREIVVRFDKWNGHIDNSVLSSESHTFLNGVTLKIKRS